MRNRLCGWSGLWAVLLAGLVQVQSGWAIAGWPGWTYQVSGADSWGISPNCTPALAGDMLYVVTRVGGPDNSGALFRTLADGSGLVVPLYQFGSTATSGVQPVGQLQPAASALYGMTTYGGTNGQGTIYIVNTNTLSVSTAYQFTGAPYGGGYPCGSLLADGFTLYGMTWQGGVSNVGTVFSYWTGFTLAGVNRYTLLHSFTGFKTDGKNPWGELAMSGNTLYGMTYGGGTNGMGILFSMQKDGSNFAALHQFAGGSNDGSNPFGSLTVSGSTLYGMTYKGGSSDVGTIFSYYTGLLALGANRFHLMHSFAGYPADGGNPEGNLTLNGTNLYGLASVGGISNCGTLFNLHADGTGYNTVMNFTGAGSAQNSGVNPYRSLVMNGKSLYGATALGGIAGNGTVFRLDLTVDPKVFFQTDAGQLAAWKINSLGTHVSSALMDNTGGWTLKAAGDVNGDGIADLIFQDASHNTACWIMNLDGTKNVCYSWGSAGDWDVRACADFEGVGKAQVLFQRTDGSLARWAIAADGTNKVSTLMGNSTAGWPLRGACDLDGDGKADLLFQGANGNMAVWKHNTNGTMYGQTWLNLGGWCLKGTVNADSDLNTDLIWQTADGTAAIWLMGDGMMTNKASVSWGSTTGWKVKAAGR